MMAPGPKKRRSEAKQEAMEQKKGTSKRLRKERSEAGQFRHERLGTLKRQKPPRKSKRVKPTRKKEGAERQEFI